ncbi:DDB1- and CUL4-associated factor 8 [Morella rubra]|uniref:DDB1-and CUL4-associated factor 8 n=1 Tax=Morella rubra TaxID=262757 RepID=A0A6A1WQS0_9ROSI|nr:DDB1- and CUL4-associated factor 8 [Morella rubra]
MADDAKQIQSVLDNRALLGNGSGRGSRRQDNLAHALAQWAMQNLVKKINLYGHLNGHEGGVFALQFNSTGDLLVSGSADKQVILWNWANKTKCLSYPSGHSESVFQTRIMPFTDDRRIVTSSCDGQVRLGQVWEDGRVDTKRLGRHLGAVIKLAVEPGSPHILYSCGEDGFVQHRSMELGPLPPISAPLQEPHVYSGHRNCLTVKGVNFFGPNDDYILSGSDCGHIFVWKKEGELVRVMILESNKEVREDHSRLTLTPDAIMHIRRLQRQQRYSRADIESDDE